MGVRMCQFLNLFKLDLYHIASLELNFLNNQISRVVHFRNEEFTLKPGEVKIINTMVILKKIKWISLLSKYTKE